MDTPEDFALFSKGKTVADVILLLQYLLKPCQKDALLLNKRIFAQRRSKSFALREGSSQKGGKYFYVRVISLETWNEMY